LELVFFLSPGLAEQSFQVLYIAFEVLGSTAAQLAFGVDIWTVKGAHLGLSIKVRTARGEWLLWVD
jgi:hypothetical protein